MCRLYLHQTRYAETAVRAAQRQVFNCRQKVTICFSAPPTTPETLIPQSVARRAKEGCLAVAGTATQYDRVIARRPKADVAISYLAPNPRVGGYLPCCRHACPELAEGTTQKWLAPTPEFTRRLPAYLVIFASNHPIINHQYLS